MKSDSHDGSFSRREFLKLAGLGLGGLALRPFSSLLPLDSFPTDKRLGRVTQMTEIRSLPSEYGGVVKTVYEDYVVEWLRDVVGTNITSTGFSSRRWVETPDGYLYAPYIQPVRFQPNEPLQAMPEGKSGFWAEVTVPYVDLYLDNPPARSPWLKDLQSLNIIPRLYYSQVGWIDQVKVGDSGKLLYRFNEDGAHGFGYGDIFWAEASAFRVLTQEDVSPINPDVDPKEKKVVVSVPYQTLSCMEGSREVFFCRCSTGAKYDAYGAVVDKWLTTGGTTWRKLISIHMSGGTTGAGYDTPAVSWTNLFQGDGIAVHAAFWHNKFGTRVSHGCVNVLPEDAKWVFRWGMPNVALEPGDITVQGTVGTPVEVVQPDY